MPIKQLPVIDVPEWLTELSSDSMKGQFPLEKLLQDSLYYPACGFDGNPIKYLAGNILSFVYVDYGYNRDDLINELKNGGFRGYKRVGERSVTERELTPKGWTPTPPNSLDGEPSRSRDMIKEPFCEWLVFERRKDFPVSHGPCRFSILYLCADGAATFQALYIGNSRAPRAVAIIQPGHGFGGNYTNFEDPNQILARSVLGNPNGQPELLLYGGWGEHDLYRESCWPDYYDKNVCFVGKNRNIGVWSRNFSRA